MKGIANIRRVGADESRPGRPPGLLGPLVLTACLPACLMVLGVDEKRDPLPYGRDADADLVENMDSPDPAAEDMSPDTADIDGVEDGSDVIDLVEEDEPTPCSGDGDCDDGRACSLDRCNLATRLCDHVLLSAGTECRPSSPLLGECDPAETCDGASPDCPPDGVSCWARVSAGLSHTCAISDSGYLYCWGDGALGQIGDGTTSDRELPTRVNADTDWDTVSTGDGHTCAVKIDASLYCWGDNTYGQVGNGLEDSPVLSPSLVDLTFILQVAAGSHHSCALGRDGDRFVAYCWGRNDQAQLGRGNVDGDAHPIPGTTDDSAGAQQIVAGSNHSFYLRNDEKAAGWGANQFGQLGLDHTSSPVSRPDEDNSGNAWIFLTAGGNHTCAIDESQPELYCWGSNTAGQLGLGDFVLRDRAERLGDAWLDVEAGEAHTCALRTDEHLYCWGDNTSHQLGPVAVFRSNVPLEVDPASTYDSVSAGGSHTCAIKTSSELFCWGSNSHGQTGTGSPCEGCVVEAPTLVVRLE